MIGFLTTGSTRAESTSDAPTSPAGANLAVQVSSLSWWPVQCAHDHAVRVMYLGNILQHRCTHLSAAHRSAVTRV